MKRKLGNEVLEVVFFTIIWCILNESWAWPSLLVGALVSLLTIVLVHRFFVEKTYNLIQHTNVLQIIQYFIQLILQVYKSGFSSITKVFHGEDNTQINIIHTQLTDEVKIGFLANAITSTPGTVTLEQQGQDLTVLSLGELERSGIDSFEKILKEDKK